VLSKEIQGRKTRHDSSESSHPREQSLSAELPDGTPVNPILAGIFIRTKDAMKRMSNASTSASQPTTCTIDTTGRAITNTHVTVSSSTGTTLAPPAGSNSFQVLAQTAVGRGIRHGYMASSPQVAGNTDNTSEKQGRTYSSDATPFVSDKESATHISQAASQYLTENSSTSYVNSSTFDFKDSENNNSLSQLASNFRNSMNQSEDNLLPFNSTDPTPLSQMINDNEMDDMFNGFLSRNSSLVELAMLHPFEYDFEAYERLNETNVEVKGFDFIDFPNPHLYDAEEMPDAMDTSELEKDLLDNDV
jgi:hypothetical protein